MTKKDEQELALLASAHAAAIASVNFNSTVLVLNEEMLQILKAAMELPPAADVPVHFVIGEEVFTLSAAVFRLFAENVFSFTAVCDDLLDNFTAIVKSGETTAEACEFPSFDDFTRNEEEDSPADDAAPAEEEEE